MKRILVIDSTSLFVTSSIGLAIIILSVQAVNVGPINAQLLYTDESTEVSIARGSALRNTTQFYDPPEAQIQAGSDIKWTNNDDNVHTVTEGKPTESGNSPAFNSGPIPPRGTFHHFFDTSGTFNYYCTIHPFMIGKVIVNPY
jgi:plastocyanin